MIRTHVHDANPDKYVYDTGLDFGVDFGWKLLDMALNKLDTFSRRSNFKKPDDPVEMTKLIGARKTRELLRRMRQIGQQVEGLTPIQFSQHFFPVDLGDELLSLTPRWISELSPGEPSTMLQVSSNGDYLGTHKGHKRRASLFMLLQGSGQETRWYRNKEDFEVIDPLRIPDHDKIEHVVTAVMQPFRWYVFNHFEWHSVHNFAPGSVRVNMGLDFNNITAEELVNLIKKEGGV